jgi:hypothetical protein
MNLWAYEADLGGGHFALNDLTHVQSFPVWSIYTLILHRQRHEHALPDGSGCQG